MKKKQIIIALINLKNYLLQRKVKKLDSYSEHSVGNWYFENLDKKKGWRLFQNGKEIAKNAKKSECYFFSNGDCCYLDTEKGIFVSSNCHLFRNNIELTKNVKAKDCKIFDFEINYWAYRDTEGHWHLFHDVLELAKNIQKRAVFAYNNGDYGYNDLSGIFFRFDKEGNKRGAK